MSSTVALSGPARRLGASLVWPALALLLAVTLMASLASGRFSIPAGGVLRILANAVVPLDHTW